MARTHALFTRASADETATLGPLRGRETEVRVINESIAAVAAGQGSTILLEGGAGIGKSRLLRETATRADRAGIAVAFGGADENHLFSPLASLVAALHNGSPGVPGDKDLQNARLQYSDRFWLLDRLHTILERSSRIQPILIILDDLQWADAVTLWVLRSITPELAGSPVMWLFGRRLLPSTPALDGLVTALVSAGGTVIEVSPLPSDAVVSSAADMIGAPPDATLTKLLDKCGGNPGMVIELLRGLEKQDALIVDSARARVLPSGPGGRLFQRLSDALAPLSGMTLPMLRVASVFGRLFDVRCVAQVLGCTVADLLPSIHEALLAGVLVEDGAQLGFRHELFREAAYGAIPVPLRRRLHREAADALLFVAGASLETVAHVIKGAEVGDTDAVAILVRASDEAASGAPGAAADLRLHALELIPHADPQRPQQVADTAWLLLRAGRADEAVTLAEAALQEPLPAGLEALLRLRLAESLGISDDAAGALHQTRVALELQAVPDPTRALLLAAETNAHTVVGDIDAALVAGETAIILAQESGNDAAICQAVLSMGAAERVRGQLTRSLDLIDQGIQLVATGSGESRRFEPEWARGRTLMTLDRFEEAAAAFASARQAAQTLGTAWTVVLGHYCQSVLLLQQGRLNEASAEAEARLISAEQLTTWTYVPELASVLAQVSAYREEPDEAREYLRRGGVYGRDPASFGAQQLAWASALIDETGQDPESVIARLAPTYDGFPDHVLPLAFDPMLGPRLVAFARRAGDVERARIAAEAAESLGRANPRVTSIVAASMQARGLFDGDSHLLAKAAQAFEESPRPLARARAYEDAGEAHWHKRKPTKAADYLRRALDTYAQLGVFSATRRVGERLASLGTRGTRQSRSRRPAFGWASLTEAELRVARLTATGLTNRATADELQLSPHTVESHLRHSFNKLGIHSRVELTRIVLLHGSVPGE
jgi:DNA-binding CsgD family transcriptional regulator